MELEALRVVAMVAPGAVVFLLAARWVVRIQSAVQRRFEHVIQSTREDVLRLERDLEEERRRRAADNARCDEQIADLRRIVRSFTPPHGNPAVP